MIKLFSDDLPNFTGEFAQLAVDRGQGQAPGQGCTPTPQAVQ